ncbi:MAG: hypothetical protein HQL89_07255 [Magnetococcales bacterium]|nr:hypothetical protein [Magnetococcales bacterium]
MAALDHITVKALPPNALLFLLLLVIGNVLRLTHGHLHPTHLPILTLALFGIGGYFALFDQRITPLRHLERWLAGLWFLFAFFLLLDEETIHATLNASHRVVNIALWINAALALYLWAGVTFADPDDPHWRRWTLVAVIVLWPVILVAVLYASPNPHIDVFHHGIEAVNHLLNGKNPYSEPLSDLYQGAYGYIPGYIYLPVILIANTLAYFFLGDIRHTYIAAQLVILFSLWRLGRQRGLSPLASPLLAMVWISFPVTLFVLEQAWNDTLLIAFVALLALSLDRQTRNPDTSGWIPTAIFLGLALGTKQYAIILGWITLLFVWRRFGMATAIKVTLLALAVLAATILPFFLRDPQAFIAHPILEVAGYRIRGDSMSWIAYILAFTRFETFGSIILELYLLFAATVTLWFIRLRRVTMFHWAWASMLIYSGLFLFGKQAFCNYYHFLAFFVLLALLSAQEQPPPEPEAATLTGKDVNIAPAWRQPIFWSLLTMAVLVRITFLDMIEFKEDEFNAIVLAWKQLTGSSLAQVGLKSSTGLYNPPFFVYLMTLPVAWTTDPRMVTLFVILLNLAGLFILYRLLRWAFSESCATLTTLLFASSPWAILYSRKIWAQDCLFPFMMGLVAVLVSLSERYRPWKVWLTFLLLAIVTQLHMSAWFLPPAILLFMLRFRIKPAWRDLAIGMAISFTLYLPYLQFHVQTGFQNILDAMNLMGHQEQPLVAGNFLWMFLVATGLGYPYVMGNDGFTRFWDHSSLALPHVSFLLFFFLTVLGLIRILGHHWPLQPMKLAQHRDVSRSNKTLTLLLMMLATIQGAYLLLSIPSFPHYGIIFYPSLFLFAVLFLEWIHDRVPYSFRSKALVGIVSTMVVANLYFTLSFHTFVLYNPQTISGDYGVPYFVNKKQWNTLLPTPGMIPSPKP